MCEARFARLRLAFAPPPPFRWVKHAVYDNSPVHSSIGTRSLVHSTRMRFLDVRCEKLDIEVRYFDSLNLRNRFLYSSHQFFPLQRPTSHFSLLISHPCAT